MWKAPVPIQVWLASSTSKCAFWVAFVSLTFHAVRNLNFVSKNWTLISRENCRFLFWVKNLRKCCGLVSLAVDNFDFTRKIVNFYFVWKTRENVVVLDFLTVDNLDFTRKIVKKLGEKLVKMLGFCQNWIVGQKFDFSNSVDFIICLINM